MKEMKIVLQSLRMSMLSHLQYRADSIVATLAVFLREATSIIVIYLTLMKFDHINGWNVNEMLFLFSLLFITYSIIVILFADLRDFSRMIREGRFDRLLVRPRGVLCKPFRHNSSYWAWNVGNDSFHSISRAGRCSMECVHSSLLY